MRPLLRSTVMLALVLGACSSDGDVPTTTSTTEATLSMSESGVGCRYEGGRPIEELEHLVDVSPGDRWSMLCSEESSGSLAAHDLNGDGVTDALVPTPGELADDRGGLAAIDGESRAVLWNRSLAHDVVSVPIVVQHDGDMTVYVAGRADPATPGEPGPLTALDGRTGKVRWRLGAIDAGWQNVYTPEVIRDVTGDDLPDLVITSGGDQQRAVLDVPERPGGVFVIDASDGSTVSSVRLPDGQETYSSPLVVDVDGTDWVVFGSGGEVLPGNAWRIRLDDLLQGKERSLRPMIAATDGLVDRLPADPSPEQIEAAVGRGVAVIAPPVAATRPDGSVAVIVVDMAGAVRAFDVDDGSQLWIQEPAATGTVPAEVLVDRAVAGFSSPATTRSPKDSSSVVVAQTLVATDDLIASMPHLGHMLLSVLDLDDGGVEAQHLVVAANSVASPLWTEQDGEPVVLCSCAPIDTPSQAKKDDPAALRQLPQGLGLWNPADGSVEPLGLRASVESTPALLSGPDDTGALLAGSTVDFAETDGLWAVTLRELASVRTDSSARWNSYLWDRQRRADVDG